MLSEINRFVSRNADFGFETTLSGRSYVTLIRRLKTRGYQVSFFFLWVPDVELAISRIRQRVLKGGHDVPEADARRRFDRSINNFLVRYWPLADSWILFDNAPKPPTMIAFEKHSELRIIEAGVYDALISRYAKTN